MGQSGVGSYIVTAIAPVDTKVPIRKKLEGTLELDGIDVARGREVTKSVVRALEGASEALAHFKSSGSMTGFVAQVEKGVSYELVKALRDIAGGADESEITVKLTPADFGSAETSEQIIHHFEFSGGDSGVLGKSISSTLAAS